MAEAELGEAAGAEGGGLAQPLDDLGFVFERGLLARHDAEDDDFPRGQVAQRREVAGPRVVVLEEVGVHVEVLEEHLGDGLVAALGEPLRPVVAAAQVDADRHVGGALRDGGVDERGVLARELVGVPVPLLGLGPHLGVAEVRQVGVVELHEPRAGLVQVGQLLLVHAREVLEEGVQCRVGLLVDGVTAVPKVDHGRRRNADLRGGLGTGGGDPGLEVLEVVYLDGLRVADFVNDHQTRGHGASHTDVRRLQSTTELYSREVLQEVDMKPLSPEFAICDRPQSSIKLLLDDVGYIFVLYLSKLLRLELAVGGLLACFENRLWPQKGTDLIGAVDTVGKGHGDVLCGSRLCIDK